jgi:hypothetical protein
MTEEQEITELTQSMLQVGMKAQTAAMDALVKVVQSEDTKDERANMVRLAGAVAFTQWKLEASLRQITKAKPQLAGLIIGAREAAEQCFGAGFDKFARDSAAEFGIEFEGESA